MEKMAEICCGGYEDAPAAYRGGSRILLQKGRLCRDEKDAALLLSNREGYEAADEIFMRERIETV